MTERPGEGWHLFVPRTWMCVDTCVAPATLATHLCCLYAASFYEAHQDPHPVRQPPPLPLVDWQYRGSVARVAPQGSMVSFDFCCAAQGMRSLSLQWFRGRCSSWTLPGYQAAKLWEICTATRPKPLAWYLERDEAARVEACA